MNFQRIQHLLDQARKQRLLVIGDVMLDEFVWGKVSRISPEAPVPVVEVQRESSYPGGACDILLRADDIVHDDTSAVQAQIVRKAFRGSEFLYTLRLHSGETVLAHVPSHHYHKIGEWICIRAEVDHVVTFDRVCPRNGALCRMPCEEKVGAQTCVVVTPNPITSAIASRSV